MTEEEYQRKVQTYDWQKLRELWKKICDDDTLGWDKGKALEYLIVRMFELSGAEVRYPYSVREDSQAIEQIDGVIYYNHLSCLLECKDQIAPINFEPIAKLRSQLMRRATAIGNVFSTSGFTEPALILVRTLSPQIVLLWHSDEIELCLKREDITKALISKYRCYIEECNSVFNITSEEI